MNSISTVIITYNEEKNIEKCIKSVLTFSDEVIVVDSHSTDATRQIACSLDKVKVIDKDWEGFAKTKNFGIKTATFDWIFSIDADEIISLPLQDEINLLKKDNLQREQVFQIKRINYYYGKAIFFSGQNNDFKLRLFNRQNAIWNENDLVHENLSFSRQPHIVKLKNSFSHFTIETIEDHISRMNRYSSLYALKNYDSKGKKHLIILFTTPFLKFLHIYFLQRGFLDGYHGFVLAILGGYSKLLRLIKINELLRNDKD